MEDNYEGAASPKAHVVGVKSWVAYFGTLILAALLFFVLLPAAFLWNDYAAAGVMVFSTALIGYRLMVLRSVQLYYDDVGVWVYAGVLPWKKGVSGVKWRDMDDASYIPGFWSWITRSYTVRIGHRFTKASEVVLTNIAGGKDAVGRLNALHQEMIRSGSVD